MRKKPKKEPLPIEEKPIAKYEKVSAGYYIYHFTVELLLAVCMFFAVFDIIMFTVVL
jgi:hypothetical protein